MSNNKHTPGPWELNETAYGSGNIGIRINSMQNVAQALWFNGDHKQTRANALLIAAAPELLACLEDLVQSVMTVPVRELPEKLLRAQKLIERAKGDETWP